MRARWPFAALAPVLLMAGGIAPAAAHPHVWITAVTTFVFEDRQLVGVRHRWTFDEFFGSFVIEEHDLDGDNAWCLRAIEAFAARIEDGALVYEFTLALPQPVDPGAVDLALGIYDSDYYVEVLLDEHDPVRFAGLASGACTFDIREDTERPIYYGMVYPLAITLACATS
jgi:ABC-type uncharacterized transport system substrate-binding protein